MSDELAGQQILARYGRGAAHEDFDCAHAGHSILSRRRSPMFKVLGFLTKRAGIETQTFIEYYENIHVPLICRLAPPPLVYKRRYLRRDEELTKEGGALDCDVVTELGFPDRAAFLAWMAQL